MKSLILKPALFLLLLKLSNSLYIFFCNLNKFPLQFYNFLIWDTFHFLFFVLSFHLFISLFCSPQLFPFTFQRSFSMLYFLHLIFRFFSKPINFRINFNQLLLILGFNRLILFINSLLLSLLFHEWKINKWCLNRFLFFQNNLLYFMIIRSYPAWTII